MTAAQVQAAYRNVIVRVIITDPHVRNIGGTPGRLIVINW